MSSSRIALITLATLLALTLAGCTQSDEASGPRKTSASASGTPTSFVQQPTQSNNVILLYGMGAAGTGAETSPKNEFIYSPPAGDNDGDFGTTPVDTPVRVEYDFGNISSHDLTVTRVEADNAIGDAFSVINSACGGLPARPEQSDFPMVCAVELLSLPKAVGDYAGSLKLFLSDNSVTTLSLHGSAAAISDSLRFRDNKIPTTGGDGAQVGVATSSAKDTDLGVVAIGENATANPALENLSGGSLPLGIFKFFDLSTAKIGVLNPASSGSCEGQSITLTSGASCVLPIEVHCLAPGNFVGAITVPFPADHTIEVLRVHATCK